jgi:aminoglycoside 3-N-acetyltransferase I
MNIEIHKLLSSDNNNFNKVLHLFRDVFWEEHQHIPPEGEQKKLLESPYFHVFVAKNWDRIVWWLTLYTFDYYTHLKKFGYIFDLAVAQDMQRQGIGSQLVKNSYRKFQKTRIRWDICSSG